MHRGALEGLAVHSLSICTSPEQFSFRDPFYILVYKKGFILRRDLEMLPSWTLQGYYTHWGREGPRLWQPLLAHKVLLPPPPPSPGLVSESPVAQGGAPLGP